MRRRTGSWRTRPTARNASNELLNRVLMEEALLRLSAEHREVLVALHYRRFTVQEASVSLNIPSGTVKSRAFYAVRALRAILDEMGVER